MMQDTMNLSNKHVLVLGYALTGKSAAEFLLKHNAKITINDRGDLSKDPSVDFLLKQGVEVIDKGHPLELLNQDIDFIIKNPGIPYSIPFIQKALEKKIPIFTDVELVPYFTDANIIGITGSNGKSTTTSLIYEILQNKTTGQAKLAGNIGIPVLSILDETTAEDDIVMELSSFQLMGTEDFRPHIAVITNLYEAHLDYHENREGYITAKLNILRNQTQEDYLVYRYDAGELHHFTQKYAPQLVPFSLNSIDTYVVENGAYVKDGWIYFRKEAILPLDKIMIPGDHNIENVLAATAVAKLKGISNDIIETAVASYRGMKHRIQPLGSHNGRIFYNDSKATNTTATITALKSFHQPIRYIGGGLDRGNEFDDLIPHLDFVQGAYLYGETRSKMTSAFESARVKTIQTFTTLQEAVKAAYLAARPGEVILLSPSCASWDQFKTFEERGDLYIETIHSLLQEYPYEDGEEENGNEN